ncbi:MAG: hypothetical protein JO166_20765 [Deltaproteobacteria bacterium]|nr:hypothetical protein [Deltaproteobacteria bacterium]
MSTFRQAEAAAYTAAKGERVLWPAEIRLQEIRNATKELIDQFSPLPARLAGKSYENMSAEERKIRVDWLAARYETIEQITVVLTDARNQNRKDWNVPPL